MADIMPAPAVVNGQSLQMKIPACDVGHGGAGAEESERLTARLDAAAARAEVQKAALSSARGQPWGSDKAQFLPEAAMQQARSVYGAALSPTAEIELPGDNELVAIWTDNESIATLRTRCTELESEGFELRERLVEVEAAEQLRSTRLQEECACMAAQAESAAAENSTLQQQLADSQAVQAEVSNLHQLLANLANEKAEAESAGAAETSRLHQQLASLANAKAEAESAGAAETSRLHQQLADLRAAGDASSKAKMEAESAASEEISSLRQQLANVHAAEGATSQAKEEVEKNLTAENSNLQQQLADLRAAEAANSKAKAEAESATSAEISRLHQQLADLAKAKAEAESIATAEISNLHQQVSDLRAALDASANSKVEAERATKEEIKSLREELAISRAAEQALAKAKADAESILGKELAALRDQLSTARAAEGAAAKAKDQAESSMAQEISSLREELSNASAAQGAYVKAKEDAESTLAAENASLIQQLVDLRAAQELRAAEDARAKDKADWESNLAAENLSLQNQVAELQIIAEEEKRRQEAEVAELREQIRTAREAPDAASSSALTSPVVSPLAASHSAPAWRRPDAEDSSPSAAMHHERKRPGVPLPSRRHVRWYEPQEKAPDGQDSVMHRSRSLPAYSSSVTASDRALRQTEPGVEEAASRRQENSEEAPAQQADDSDGFQWQLSASETEDQGFTSEDYHGNEGSEEEHMEEEEDEGSICSEDVYQEDEEDEGVDDAIKDLEDFREEDTEDEEGDEHLQEDPDDELWTAGQDDARQLSAVEEEDHEQEEDPYDYRTKEEGIYSECDFSARSAGSQGARFQDDPSYRTITFSDKVSMVARPKAQAGPWMPADAPPSVQVPSQAAVADAVNRASLTRRGLRAPVGSGTLHPGNDSARTHSMSPEPSGRPSAESKTPPVPAMALPRAGSPHAFTAFQGRVMPHTTRASPSFGSPRQSCQLRPMPQPVGSPVAASGRGDTDSARAITPGPRTVPMSSPLRPATHTTTSTPILAGKAGVAATSSTSGANPNEAPAPGLIAGAVSAGTAAAKAPNSGSVAAPAGPVAGGTGVRVAQAVQRLQGAMVTPVKQRPEDIGRAQYTYVAEASGVPVRSLPATAGPAPAAPAGAATAPGSLTGDRGVATPPQCQPRLTHAGVALVRPANWPPA